jgi:hypothetical protein
LKRGFAMVKTVLTLKARVSRLASALAAGLALMAVTSAHAGLIEGAGPIGGGGIGGTSINSFIVNPDGVGHHLIVPAYSAQGDYATILNLVNTDLSNGKAVKVRFRTAVNGDSVFSITVFIGPGDVWNGVVSRNPTTGVAQFSSGDGSCTLPALAANVPRDFSTARLNPALSAADRASHTREGYVEILTMADIQASSTVGSLFQAIIGGNAGNGLIRSCNSTSVLSTLNDTRTESTAAAMGLSSPNGSLSATWTIIHVPQTLTFSGTATALLGVDSISNLPGRGNYILFPQSEAMAGGVDDVTADPLLRSNPAGSKTDEGRVRAYLAASLPLIKPTFADLPDLSTPFLLGELTPMAQASAISKLFAAKFARNNYATDPSISAGTDWVMTHPTKRFSVAQDYMQSLLVYNVMPGLNGMEYFHTDNIVTLNGKTCTNNRFAFYDRESGSKITSDPRFSASALLPICGVSGAMLFGAKQSSALGWMNSTESLDGRSFVNGWGQIDLSNGYTGMPVMGVAFIKGSNPSASPGVSGNYGISSAHKYSR